MSSCEGPGAGNNFFTLNLSDERSGLLTPSARSNPVEIEQTGGVFLILQDRVAYNPGGVSAYSFLEDDNEDKIAGDK
jgi:hypothetical protein